MSVLQSFSRHLPTYTTIAVVGRPTRGLPVDCRRRQAVPNISAHNLPATMILPEFNVLERNDTVPASTAVVGRRTRGRPVDCRTRQAFPSVSVYDTTTFRASRYGRRPSVRQSVRHEVVRSTAVRAKLFRTFPYTTRLASGDERTRAVATRRRPAGRSVGRRRPPRGLHEPFCEARGFFGWHRSRPPSPI